MIELCILFENIQAVLCHLTGVGVYIIPGRSGVMPVTIEKFKKGHIYNTTTIDTHIKEHKKERMS